MDILFFLLGNASLLVLITALIKPSWILGWGNPKFQTRKYAALIFGTAFLLFFILFLITTPELPEEEKAVEILPVIEVEESATTLHQKEVTPAPKIEEQDTIEKAQVAVSTEPPPVVEKVQESEDAFLVTRVIDGDTIEIEGGLRVRYIGIDTPETVDPRKLVQCFGVEASNRNKELVDGKYVRLEKDVSETDKYNRLLRYVYAGDTFVNLILVKDGFAYSSTYPPDVKYQDQFVEAQHEAREQNKGLWGSCPIAEPTPEPTQPTPPSGQEATPPPSEECSIKGNISSSGEKIYHVEGCSSYNVTKIDEARGEKYFCTENEAVEAGWRKAKNCP